MTTTSQRTSIKRGPIQQIASPVTATTVILLDDPRDVTLWNTPAGSIATLAVQIPADSATIIGQIVMIKSSQAIAAITVQGASGDSGTTVYGSPFSLSVGGTILIQKQASKTWG